MGDRRKEQINIDPLELHFNHRHHRVGNFIHVCDIRILPEHGCENPEEVSFTVNVLGRDNKCVNVGVGSVNSQTVGTCWENLASRVLHHVVFQFLPTPALLDPLDYDLLQLCDDKQLLVVVRTAFILVVLGVKQLLDLSVYWVGHAFGALKIPLSLHIF